MSQASNQLLNPLDAQEALSGGQMKKQAPPPDQESGGQYVYQTYAPMPSKLIDSYAAQNLPARLYIEDQHSMTQNLDTAYDSSGQPSGPLDQAQLGTSPGFATAANGLINKILDRTPSGGSVVEPDSVLGDSQRLYHGYKEGRYFLPNDAAEQDRLDLQHEQFRLILCGWLSLVPFSKPPRYVLDIGTGTGLWAQEFAEQNPSSLVVGTDLSAIQPLPRVPNCIFIKSDVEEDEWIFPEPNPDHSNCSPTTGCHDHSISFDYIHLRLMFSCFNDPRVVMNRAFKNLRPGGWIEFQEGSFTLIQTNPDYKGTALHTWAANCVKGAATVGRNVDNVQLYKDYLIEAGFVDVSERQLYTPLGDWHSHPYMRLVGSYVRANLLEGLKSIAWKMLRLAGMEADEIDSLLSEAREQVQDRNSRILWKNYIVIGRKPHPTEVEGSNA
ncbi:S-adenosyl-L-methionine-dependent methyltransferase [Xylariales sp. PMI_506]|nr:S-adenosyl-L-methionine-dependent methyltransferase [Xylariales sp. PMI_506]